MQIDLRRKRKEAKNMGLTITQSDMAKALGLSRTSYSLYDQSVYPLNANMYYKLHKAYPQVFKLPDDFYEFTAKNFKYNMKISGKTQKEAAPAVHLKQSRLSQILAMEEEYFLYDYKDEILKLFTPYFVNNDYMENDIQDENDELPIMKFENNC